MQIDGLQFTMYMVRFLTLNFSPLPRCPIEELYGGGWLIKGTRVLFMAKKMSYMLAYGRPESAEYTRRSTHGRVCPALP